MKKITQTMTMAFVGIALVMVVAFTSCKKEEPSPTPSPTPTSKTKTELVTGGAWKLTALTVDPAYPIGGTTITNFYNQLDACDKDDLVTYKTNGQVAYDEGNTKCNPSDPQTTTGTWVFNTTETIISETDNTGTTSYNVVELSSSTLKMSYVEAVNGINYTFTGTWSH